MRRQYPEQPIIGVGGIIFNQRSVLLVKRDQEPGRGEWSLPGGVVELGETLEKALKREIREEVSIEIETMGLVGLRDHIIYDSAKNIRYHYVIANYWGWRVSGDVQAGSDINDAAFVEIVQIKKQGVRREVEEFIHLAVKMRDSV